MSEISKTQILYLAKLAKLNLTPQDVAVYQKELSIILEFINQLRAVDISQVAATEQITQLSNVWREDQVKPDLGLSANDLALNTNLFNHQFKVPKVNI